MLKAAQKLSRFLNAHKTVHCAPGGRGFRIDGVFGAACGITKLLQETFYPNYRYTGKCKQQFDYVYGAKRGTLVDSQVRDIVFRLFHPDAKPKHKKMHIYTKKIMASLKLLELTPAYAQCYVGDASTRIATGVDLVCLDDKTKRPVLIELKMGFNGTLDSSNGAMKHFLRDFPNSPRYQHQLQLAVTYELFKRTYGLEPVRCIILNANDHGVKYHDLEPQFQHYAPMILQYLSNKKEKKK